jgi:signal transduction histidine kinase
MKGSSIQVSSYLDDEVTKLAIADTGIGMLEQNKAMLLDMEEANLHCKTGLHTGLPLIKALAEYNDCEIVIEDSYNNMQTTGSKFTLCIPTV